MAMSSCTVYALVLVIERGIPVSIMIQRTLGANLLCVVPVLGVHVPPPSRHWPWISFWADVMRINSYGL